MNTAIVSTQWVFDNLENENIVILDGSFPEQPPVHIPGARYFDIDQVADPNAPFAHTLPNAEKFAQEVQALGISNDTQIVVYSADGVAMAACRVWWMFKCFGHENVAVMDGGLPKWQAENRPLTPEPTTITPSTGYNAQLNPDLVVDKDDVLQAINDRASLIVDARAAPRFANGHMPGAGNIPFMTLLNEDGTFKSKEDLEALFQAHDLDDLQPIISSCGSGVTACVLAVAYYHTRKKFVRVYDGSWTEWGSCPNVPIEVAA